MIDEKYILIVDDEEEIIESIIRKIYLEKANQYVPLVAIDGYEALEFMRTKNVALVVLDIRMRNLDGLTVCRKAKADVKMKKIPIIISSAVLDEQVRNELSGLGIQHFLEKPYLIEHLFKKIDEILVLK